MRYGIPGGLVVLRGGIWTGDECVFEFADTRLGVSGAIRCDWRKEGPASEVHYGDPEDPEVRRLCATLAGLMMPFHEGAFRGIADEDLDRLYSGDYHERQNYSTNSESESRFKAAVIDVLLGLLEPGKVLDAGCSAGEVVRQLRRRGIEAFGFDLCRNLDEIAYSEVRPFLRRGSATAIPFGPEDGFDTLLALDLFEHLPEDRILAVVAEIERLGIRRVVAHIAHCEFQYVGHITLRPQSWWDRSLAPRFPRVAPRCGDMARAFGADESRYLSVYEFVPEAVPT